MKFSKKLEIVSKKSLIVNRYAMKNIKTKIKSYKRKINPKIHNNKIPKEGCHCIYLSVILINSAFRKDKNYYSEVFLDECKYFVKRKKDT